MSTAKLYCSASVVDRLTRPMQVVASEIKGKRDENTKDSINNSNGMVIDAATFIGTLQNGTFQHSFTTPSDDEKSPKGPGTNPIARASAAAANQNTTAKKVTSKQDFNNFLERQKIVLKRKEENVKKVI